jgi:hypothetical protein
VFRVNVLVLAVVCAVSAVPAEAQYVSSLHILPVVAKLAGAAGTDWMTAMSVSNVSDETVNVTAMFFRENTNNQPFAGPEYTFGLAAGRTMTVDDVLGSWFPGQGNTKGFLILLAEASGGGDEALIAATARVFNNANPNATYGQAVSSNLTGFVFGRGTAVMPGARWDGRARSNVGVVNLSFQPLSVLVTTFDADGAVVSSVTRQVSTFSLAQWSLSQLGVSTLSPPGRVEVMVDPASITWDPCDPLTWGPGASPGLFMTYMSKVDQATGDAEFAYGQNDWTEFENECGTLPDDCP